MQPTTIKLLVLIKSRSPESVGVPIESLTDAGVEGFQQGLQQLVNEGLIEELEDAPPSD